MGTASEFYLRTMSPIHIGCDEAYEPMSFVVDEASRELFALEPLDFIKALDAGERSAFSDICRKGTIASILELYRFMRGRRASGNGVRLCPGFLDHYRKTLALPLHDSRKIQQELANFTISRTAFHPHSGRPYVPGSAIKGALRTAYLNAQAKKHKTPTPGGRYAARELETRLLEGGSFDTDPFRLVKVSDFMPAGPAQTRIVYAVNKKKRPSKFEARGPFQILEVLMPGTLLRGTVTVLPAPVGSGIKTPVSLEKILESLQHFFGEEAERETVDLNTIGAGSAAWQRGGNAFLLRVGRHSGAESVTIMGHRSIRIKQGAGQKPRFEDHSTTLWLVAEQSKTSTSKGLTPFGWAALEPASEDHHIELQQQKEEKVKRQIETVGQGATMAEEIPAGKQPVKPATAEIVRETWADAILSWSPGNQTLSATSGNKKATCHGKELIPEAFHSKLFGKKKKSVAAPVQVESVGNAYRIVSIEE